MCANTWERLHASPTMAVVAVTGGGGRALSWLINEPGASRTVLEGLVPYAPSALQRFLGDPVAQSVSEDTASDMALAAYRRARRLRDGDVPVVGVGCTAAIATDRPLKGQHRCFVTAWTRRDVASYGVTFAKGHRDRAGEEEVVSKLVIRAMAEASEVESVLPLGLLDGEHLEVLRLDHGDLVDQLLAGQVDTVTSRADGSSVDDEPVRGAVLSGSFDPLHEGHEELAGAAASMLGAEVTFELSVRNVDKPPLLAAEVRSRLEQFAGRADVVITRAPTFTEKCDLFAECTFAIGWDTATRLVDPAYYGGDEAAMLGALAGMKRNGCRFLVAGRVDKGDFRTLADVPVPSGFGGMFTAIPQASFRRDLSSTELRVAAPSSQSRERTLRGAS